MTFARGGERARAVAPGTASLPVLHSQAPALGADEA